MAKPEWGTKRICPSCGTRYYDLMREQVICPKCSTPYDAEAFLKARRSRPVAAGREGDRAGRRGCRTRDRGSRDRRGRGGGRPHRRRGRGRGGNPRGRLGARRGRGRHGRGHRQCRGRGELGFFACWPQSGFLSSRPTSGGAIAQLGERYNGIVEVTGSIPVGSTNSIKGLDAARLGPWHFCPIRGLLDGNGTSGTVARYFSTDF